MTEDVSNAFKLGVDLSLSALVITGAVILTSTIQQTNAVIADQQRYQSAYRDYLEFNAYDNNEVRPQDIVTAVMTYKGTIAVYVWNDAAVNPQYSWSTTEKATNFTTTEILSKLDQNAAYQATLQKGLNGEVTAICFKKK